MNVSVSTSAGCACTVSVPVGVTWVTITGGLNSTGQGTASFTVSANSTGAQLSTTLTIAGQPFTLTELAAAATCNYSLSENNQSFPSTGGGPFSVTVTTTAGCAWTVTVPSGVTWVTINTGLNSTGSGATSFTVASNSSALRSTTLTIAGQSFTVSEAAGQSPGHPAFFNGEVPVGTGGVYYLQFPDGNVFGYYNYQGYPPFFYSYSLGFEAFIDGGNGAAYLYDFTSSHWWYTNPSLFPYLYDFTLNNWLFYFTNSTSPRYFSDITTGKIISQ